MYETEMFAEKLPRKNRISLTAFSGANDTEKLRAAADYLAKNPGTVLTIPEGIYVITDPKGKAFMEDILAGKYGDNPYLQMFKRDRDYGIGVSFYGIKSCTVEAYGVTFAVDGFMEPFNITACDDFEIKGFAVDGLRRPYTSGTVIKQGKGFIDVKYNEEMGENPPSPRMFFINPTNGNIVTSADSSPLPEKEKPKKHLANGAYRYPYKMSKNVVGLSVNTAHSWHFRPCIFINESTDIRVTDVKLHNHDGMGVVAHRSSDLFFNRLMVVPAPGEYTSTNTDATHFVSCTGKIRFECCHFDGQGDDALNIHSFYLTILGENPLTPAELADKTQVENLTGKTTFKKLDYKSDASEAGRECFFMGDGNAKGYSYDIGTRPRTGTHSQKLDHPNPGDTLMLVHLDTLAPAGNFNVLSVYCNPAENTTTVLLDRELPKDKAFKFYKLTNLTQRASLDFLGSHIRNHLARGILVRTRDVLIEGCSFDRCVGSAIHIASEISWHECGASENVTIRNNHMTYCNERPEIIPTGTGIGIYSGGNKKNKPCDGGIIHKNIVIEDNVIDSKIDKAAMTIKGVDGLTIRRNSVAGDIVYSNCENVKIENNRFSSNTY